MVPAAVKAAKARECADLAHQARRPPAADEEAEEMRRSQQTDLGRGKAQHLARDRIERRHAPGAELQQDDRQEQGGEGNEKAHGGPRWDGLPDAVCLPR